MDCDQSADSVVLWGEKTLGWFAGGCTTVISGGNSAMAGRGGVRLPRYFLVLPDIEDDILS